jgi:hypothetical protein
LVVFGFVCCFELFCLVFVLVFVWCLRSSAQHT